MDLHTVDKIARGSGIAVYTILQDCQKSLDISDTDILQIRPTVAASAYNNNEGESVTLAILFTLAGIKGRKLKLFFTADGEEDIIIPVE